MAHFCRRTLEDRQQLGQAVQERLFRRFVRLASFNEESWLPALYEGDRQSCRLGDMETLKGQSILVEVGCWAAKIGSQTLVDALVSLMISPHFKIALGREFFKQLILKNSDFGENKYIPSCDIMEKLIERGVFRYATLMPECQRRDMKLSAPGVWAAGWNEAYTHHDAQQVRETCQAHGAWNACTAALHLAWLAESVGMGLFLKVSRTTGKIIGRSRGGNLHQNAFGSKLHRDHQVIEDGVSIRDVENAFRGMKLQGLLSPSGLEAPYLSLLHAYGTLKQWKPCVRMLREMRANGVRCNRRNVLLALIRAASLCGHDRIIDALWSRMHYHCQSLREYEVVMKAYSRLGNTSQVVSLFYEAEHTLSSGTEVAPDLFSVRCVALEALLIGLKRAPDHQEWQCLYQRLKEECSRESGCLFLPFDISLGLGRYSNARAHNMAQ